LKPFLARSARQDAAQAEVSHIDLGIAWQEWQVAQHARLLVARLQWLTERVKLARDELTFEAGVAATLDQALKAGDATVGQVGVQRASLEGVRRSLHEIEQSRLEAESEFKALLGNLRLTEVVVPEPAQFVAAPAPDLSQCLLGRIDLAAL